MRIAITGSEGMLGRTLQKTLSSHELFPLSKQRCDITNPKVVHSVLSDLRPDVVIHCAAMTKVDKCEVEQQTVENVLEADALLNFVDVDVMGFVVNDAADDALVEPLSALGLLVSDVVQVEADDVILRNTLSAQRFPVQMEKRRLSRAPRSHDDLDEMRLTQTLQAIEVARARDEMRRSVHGEILFLF